MDAFPSDFIEIKLLQGIFICKAIRLRIKYAIDATKVI